MIAVHESALDSIKAMGQRDKERIEKLENALKIIATWAGCDSSSPDSRVKAMGDIHKKAMSALRVNTYSTAIIQKAE